MPVSDRDIDLIFEDLVLRENVNGALETTINILGGHAGTLMAKTGEGAQVRAAFNINPESIYNYHSDLQQEDWMLHMANAAPNAPILLGSSAIDLRAREKTEYFSLVNEPSEIYDALCIQLVNNDALFGFTVYRPHRQTFDQAAVEDAAFLQPHMERAFRLLSRKKEIAQTSDWEHENYRFTAKEADIIALLRNGMGYAEICAVLSIRRNTLKWHMKNIFSKARVSNKAALMSKL